MSTPTPTSHVTYRHPQHGTPSLTVEGVEVAHAIGAGFTITVPAPDGPVEARVTVLADDFTFDGDATVTVDMPDAVRAALAAAGWTSPEGADPRHGLRLEIVASAHAEDVGDEACGPSCPHFVRLKGRNGETVMHSENYATRSNARRAAKNLAAKLGITDVREVTA